jgi:hypothetical protein
LFLSLISFLAAGGVGSGGGTREPGFFLSIHFLPRCAKIAKTLRHFIFRQINLIF